MLERFASALYCAPEEVRVLAPRVQRILDAGAAAGTIRADVRAEDLINALARLADGSGDGTSGLMTGVLLDGLLVASSRP